MGYKTTALKDRAVLYREIRKHFDSAGFIEAETPLMAPSPIPESNIELFRTDRIHSDGTTSPLYLLPSPEYWLKLLLASGVPSLYQIGRCFRNGEQLDRWHRLEFTMLEWYALNTDAEGNITVMQNLLETCSEAISGKVQPEVGGSIRRITMEEAFQEFAGFSLETDLRDAGLAEIGPEEEEYNSALKIIRDILAERLKERGLPCGESTTDGADDHFHRLFLTLVEESLPADRPLVLTEWPMLVPTLARRKEGTPWAERWELYIRGVEVANCYGEENKRKALESYWEMESVEKKKASVPLDAESNWPEIIAAGLPSCSGVAVGLDRLLALIRGDDGLQGLDLFPIHDIMPR